MMKYAALFTTASFIFIVLGHFRAQRKKQEELERNENLAAFERAKHNEEKLR
jgi:hypothetical protein